MRVHALPTRMHEKLSKRALDAFDASEETGVRPSQCLRVVDVDRPLP
jgi:hypothetical protein